MPNNQREEQEDSVNLMREVRAHTPHLIPKSVTITSQFKSFGLQEGKSFGTEVAITFDVMPDLEGAALKRQMLVEKEKLDIFSILSEVLRGGVTAEFAQEKREEIKQSYDRILGRKNKTPESGGGSGDANTRGGPIPIVDAG